MTRMTRRIAAALIATAVSLVAAEFALRWLDPLGAYRYYTDARALQALYQSDPARGYILPPGVYHMARWSFTILPDTGRYVPDSNPDGPCHVVAIGDSVTFGSGVEDSQTWPNYYAEMTGCRVDLFALPGWNIQAVLQAKRAADTLWPDVDRYIYLMVNNDHLPLPLLEPKIPFLTAARVYLTYAQMSGEDEAASLPAPDAAFYATLDELMSDERVQVFGFEHDMAVARRVARTQRRIALLAPYTSRVSWADAHPDAAGQREIAERIAEVETWH